MNILEYKGFKARIMESERLSGEHSHGLPPGSPLEVYHSYSFRKYPGHWMKGPGVFVVPVRPDKGLWFDWTMNDYMNTAVVPTVKGCNPLTGLRTEGFHLEQYKNKCPRHGIEFGSDRYCPECGYKWKPQNYVSYPNTLWWDTWATENGAGRQLYFTEEEARDAAGFLIGKQETVPAFGFAFFSTREKRENLLFNCRIPHEYTLYTNPKTFVSNSGTPMWVYDQTLTSDAVLRSSTSASYSCSVDSSPSGSPTKSSGIRSILRSKTLYSNAGGRAEESIPDGALKEVSVGAGAKIAQDLTEDPLGISGWNDKPESVMTVYFVFEKEFEQLLAGGLVEPKREGMLDGFPVG